MKPSLLASTLILLLALVSLSAQEDKPVGLRFVGCYELHIGRWWPWGFGEDDQFVTAPRQIELESQRGTQGFEEGEFLISAVSPGPARRKAFWQPEPRGNGIVLTWTDGFTGLTVKLTSDRNGLSGWAHPHFDTPQFIPRIAHVTARPIPCKLDSGSDAFHR